MTQLSSCGPSLPTDVNENWFFTDIFPQPDSIINLQYNIVEMHAINKDTIFILADDRNYCDAVRDHDGNVKIVSIKTEDVSAFFLWSKNGGQTFEKQNIGNGTLTKFSVANNAKSLYMLFEQYDPIDSLWIPGPIEYHLLKSIDFGETWEKVYVFKDKLIHYLVFVDDLVGFAFFGEDPKGYDIMSLYQTSDGGKSWNRIKLDIKDLAFPTATKDKQIIGIRSSKPEFWSLDIISLEVSVIPSNLPKHSVIESGIKIDPITGNFYVLYQESDINGGDLKEESYLYCLNDREIIKLPDNSDYFNVYGDFIGAMGEKDSVSKYYHSRDKGKTWHTETPKEYFAWGVPEMFGEGYVWVISNAVLYPKAWPLMIRIPDVTDELNMENNLK